MAAPPRRPPTPGPPGPAGKRTLGPRAEHAAGPLAEIGRGRFADLRRPAELARADRIAGDIGRRRGDRADGRPRRVRLGAFGRDVGPGPWKIAELVGQAERGGVLQDAAHVVKPNRSR